MNRMFLVVAVFTLTLSACCAAYKGAVEKYVDKLPDRGKVYYPKVLTPELRKDLVLQDATLICLVDKDKKKSTKEAPTSACKCADGLPNNWENNCADFMK